eukprot:gnl/Hemi2/13292_TR4560_c0_g1_i1.p1 gnl/Hemi2/13292_TR4560_c0_g1~~gnl/Hemi2/13292_TR4560_c0_g1_i1.p1  ORF type:complete len:328 (-),score=51.16 gnl/Hemi2/13292_TR4560_c0_g1_i1:99-1082(-)
MLFSASRFAALSLVGPQRPSFVGRFALNFATSAAPSSSKPANHQPSSLPINTSIFSSLRFPASTSLPLSPLSSPSSPFSFFRLGFASSPNNRQLQKYINNAQNELRRVMPRFYYEIQPEYRIIGWIIFANLVVFAMWQSMQDQGFMYRHFTASERNLRSGRIWTLITSAFSHRDARHLIFNMITLFFFGRSLIIALGPQLFYRLYFGAALTASVSHIVYSNYIMPRIHGRAKRRGQFDFPCLGASGAILGMNAVYACMFPRHTIMLYMVVPVPAVVLIGGLAAYDLYLASRGRMDGSSHAGHIAGGLFGVAYYILKLRGMRLYPGGL